MSTADEFLEYVQEWYYHRGRHNCYWEESGESYGECPGRLTLISYLSMRGFVMDENFAVEILRIPATPTAPVVKETTLEHSHTDLLSRITKLEEKTKELEKEVQFLGRGTIGAVREHYWRQQTRTDW